MLKPANNGPVTDCGVNVDRSSGWVQVLYSLVIRYIRQPGVTSSSRQMALSISTMGNSTQIKTFGRVRQTDS